MSLEDELFVKFGIEEFLPESVLQFKAGNAIEHPRPAKEILAECFTSELDNFWSHFLSLSDYLKEGMSEVINKLQRHPERSKAQRLGMDLSDR